MVTKTLSSSNRFLKSGSARKQIITNVSSNTAIETGTASSVYISRLSSSGHFQAKSDSIPRKK